MTDDVMGSLSHGQLKFATVAGSPALRVTGEVRTENNGGFVKMALDLAPGGTPFDASAWSAISLDVCGPPEEDDSLHLRSADLVRP